MMEYGKLVGREVVPTNDVLEAFGPDRSDRRVARDELAAGSVSTVFLGIDHGWGGSHLWFETMIFGGPHDQWQDRYETYDQAEAGHKRVVAALKAGESPDPTKGNADG